MGLGGFGERRDVIALEVGKTELWQLAVTGKGRNTRGERCRTMTRHSTHSETGSLAHWARFVKYFKRPSL
jgi:hypothetical protein